MQPHTFDALLALNRQFYAQFGGEFAATRRSHPPGYERILPHLRAATNVLDLGCGNGRLLAFLAQRGWGGRYVGMDSSARLLEEAAAVPLGGSGIQTVFLLADLFDEGWPARAQAVGPCDAVACLATLHHIPGAAQRSLFLARCAGLLPAGRPLILSTWQFMSSERLRRRVVPWAAVGIAETDLEPGDTLVGWGAGSPGARYCAAIDEGALIDMAARASLDLVETFHSDGHEGNLNLYGVFAPRP